MTGNRVSAEITKLLEDGGRYLAFPSVARLAAEKFLLLFHDAPLRDPAVQHDPKSLLGTITGRQPWSPDPGTRRAIPRFSGAGNAASAVRLSDTRALILGNSWRLYNWMGEPEVRIISDYNWVTILRGGHAILTDTSGETLRFGKPSRITSLHYPVVSCYDAPIALDENTVLCPVDYDSNCTQMQEKPWETIIMKTDDQGKTWRLHSEIFMEKDNKDFPRLHQPSVKRLPDGRFICILNSYEPVPQIYITESAGDGTEWTKPRPAGFSGFFPSLITLSDGRLIIAYSQLREPYRVKFRISDDGGATWPESSDFTVDTDSHSHDFGHVRGLQLDDGSVFLVYYLHRPSGLRSIMGAGFKI